MEVTIKELERVEEKLDLLLALHDIDLVSAGLKACYTIKDIARIEGVSEASLYEGGKYRYLLPFFGESEYEGTARWKVKTFIKWREIPVDVRKGMAVEMLTHRKDAYTRMVDEFMGDHKEAKHA